MNKRLLTLDDLYSYYSTMSSSSHFSSQDANSPIVVQVEGKLNFEESSDTDGLQPVVLQSCHIKKNINGSNIKQEVMEKALPSFKNRPILGYIHEVNGQYEFYGHNMHLNEDDDIVYDEIPVGVIPESCNARLEYDEEKDKTYCVVNGYLYEEYTKATEILKREKECSVSVELCIREMSYQAKEKFLDIEDFYFSGVTILGKDEDGNVVNPGMVGSNIKLSDFSAENNSMFSRAEIDEKLVDTLEKLNATLESFNINNTERKEEIDVDKEKFEEEVTETVEEEVTATSTEEEVTEIEEMSEETVDETPEETVEEVVEEMSEETEEETQEESNEEFAEEVVEEIEELKEFSKIFEVKFEISHEEILYALYNLIGQFDELDNEWYSIHSVYDTYFVIQGWYTGALYGCKYVKDGDNVSLEGERWALHMELLTDSEKAKLDEMRSNYSTIQNELNSYKKAELDAAKDAIFAEEAYADFLETAEFKELISQKDDYSLEELKDKAELAFAKCVKQNKTFSFNEGNRKIAKHTFANPAKVTKKKPYGTLFD